MPSEDDRLVTSSVRGVIRISPILRGAVPRIGIVAVLLLGLAATARAQESGSAARDAAQRPVVVWPTGPLEVVAAFERPVAPAAARAMIGRTIPYGEAGTNNPSRQAHAAKPAGSLRIVGARLLDDGRHARPGHRPPPSRRALCPANARAPTGYDLSGIEAIWSERDDPSDGPSWTGWWPSLDFDATRRLARGSRPHETGLALLSRPGRLRSSAGLRLPPGKVAFRIESSGRIEEATLGDAQLAGTTAGKDGGQVSELAVESRGEPLFLTLTARTGEGTIPLTLGASYRPAGEPAEHGLERDRLQVPWAPVSTDPATAAPVTVPDLTGGDPERGRTIFRGDQSRCAQCHSFRGEGGLVGPDLTNIAAKGPADIYRSIAAPSAVIEPDFTTYTVATRDGQVLSGVARAEGPDGVRVTDTNARTTTVRRDRIQEMRPSATSIMPPGLAAALGDSAVRDLIAYLISPAAKSTAGRPSTR